MIFFTNMYPDNLWNPVLFQSHRSKVKVTWVKTPGVHWQPHEPCWIQGHRSKIKVIFC